MINVKNLSNFLTKNVRPDLYTSIYILSLTGSLVAYSTPTNTRTLRDQAALIQLSWQDYSSTQPQNTNSKLKAIILESESQNVIVRAIKNDYVLVLLGPVSGTEAQQQVGLKTTPEVEGGERYPPMLEDEDGKIDALVRDAGKNDKSKDEGDEGSGENGEGNAEQVANQEESEVTLLHLQRRKAESMYTYLEEYFGDAVAVEDLDYSKLFQ